MRIGYSFWGFLGPGITDTPDGGRSHRRTLIDGLIAAGHDIVFLQRNRDLDEAGHDLRHRYAWDDGLPDIDALFLEWRWPIPGRNTTRCGSPGHTCDLHRQDELLAHYTLGHRTADDPVGQGPATAARLAAAVSCPASTVCEAALAPSPGAVSLLFPVADDALDGADPVRPWPRCPGRCRWSTSATSTTATRRSARSSRPPPHASPAPRGREMDAHRATGRTSTSPAAAPSPTSGTAVRVSAGHGAAAARTGTPAPGR